MAPTVRRYLDLIRQTLRVGGESRRAVSIPSRGRSMDLALPVLAGRIGIQLDASLIGQLDAHAATLDDETPAVDGGGHRRPMYDGLLARYTTPTAVYGEAATTRCGRFVADAAPLRADNAAVAVGVAFDALAIGDVRPIDFIVAQQRDAGWFIDRTGSDNPEPLWYHELSLLHAVVQCDAKRFAEPIRRSAEYHAIEVQPDHASSHPLALAALLRVPNGVFLVDMMLHAAGVQSPSTMDTVSLLLLHDALMCAEAD
jgi:hypothetical protein